MYNNSLSLTKVISGVQRILGVTSQIVPLYNKVKPTIDNAKSIINNIPIKSMVYKKKAKSSDNPKKNEKKTFNSPQFFL